MIQRSGVDCCERGTGAKDVEDDGAKELQEHEERTFTRRTLTKTQRKDLKRSQRIGVFDDFDDFGDLESLSKSRESSRSNADAVLQVRLRQ